MSDRPPYLVPTMEHIRELPWNGRNVISTFAGGGGSSTGYRMAGYRVLLASEFVPAAVETYAANAAPYTVIDSRDIREVSGIELLARAGLGVGELDILDGSPPCASFSTAGKRSEGWGQVKVYSDTSQRSDDLFYEFTRLLHEVQPRVFVAENVSGLVKGEAKGYFKAILTAMKAAGYKVSARLVNAARLDVPQARQRIIFIGVRADIDAEPVHPEPLPYLRPVSDALPEILSVRTHKGDRSVDIPAPTVLTMGRAYTHTEMTTIAADGLTLDPETGFSISLGDYAIGRDWDYLIEKHGAQNGRRYQSSSLALPARPSPTVTARGGTVNAASVMHPTERRKFTLGELRAICGFPADYILTGTYTQRWERLGRSVPPLMMRAIAETVRDRILSPVTA